MIQTHTLIDCGASGISLIDNEFVRHHQITKKTQKESREFKVID
jgi:hypothetical protein